MSDPPRLDAYPVNSVIGGVGPDEVAPLLDGLVAEDVDRGDIEIICGTEGLARLDADGRQHRWRDRLVRWTQHLGAEAEHLHRMEELVREGAMVVKVGVGDEEGKTRVAAVLARHGGRDVHFVGRRSIEDLPA